VPRSTSSYPPVTSWHLVPPRCRGRAVCAFPAARSDLRFGRKSPRPPFDIGPTDCAAVRCHHSGRQITTNTVRLQLHRRNSLSCPALNNVVTYEDNVSILFNNEHCMFRYKELPNILFKTPPHSAALRTDCAAERLLRPVHMKNIKGVGH